MKKKKDEIQASVTVKLADNGKTYHANASDCFSVFYRNGMPYVEAVNDYSIKLEEAKKEKNELLNFAFNEQDEKIKFYRETLVEMTKEAYRKMPNELKIEESVVEADLLTKAIMKQVDEFEREKTNMWSPNYDPSYNMTTTIIDHLGFEGNKQKVNPDYFKTEPMGIRDSVKEEVLNKFIETANVALHKKPYGTLDEHWKELMDLFEIKEKCSIGFIKGYTNEEYYISSNLDSIKEKLGIEFIEDFVKACEKCEE